MDLDGSGPDKAKSPLPLVNALFRFDVGAWMKVCGGRRGEQSCGDRSRGVKWSFPEKIGSHGPRIRYF